MFALGWEGASTPVAANTVTKKAEEKKMSEVMLWFLYEQHQGFNKQENGSVSCKKKGIDEQETHVGLQIMWYLAWEKGLQGWSIATLPARKSWKSLSQV